MLISYEQEKNRRQVPKTSEYLKVKDYCDYLYCYLQVNSSFDEANKIRYILKKDLKFAAVGRDLEMSRQTAKKKFDKLVELGLVVEENYRYVLVTLDKTLAELVPFSTLRILTNTVQDKVISVYVYLLVRYRAEQQRSFIFTLKQIKAAVGVGESKSTDYIVTDILVVLKKLGLLEYELGEAGSDEGYKTIYKVSNMNNKIEEQKLDSDAELIQKC